MSGSVDAVLFSASCSNLRRIDFHWTYAQFQTSYLLLQIPLIAQLLERMALDWEKNLPVILRLLFQVSVSECSFVFN